MEIVRMNILPILRTFPNRHTKNIIYSSPSGTLKLSQILQEVLIEVFENGNISSIVSFESLIKGPREELVTQIHQTPFLTQ